MKSDGEELRRSIRLRPSMCIGGVGTSGLQSLVEPWLLLGFMGRGEGSAQDVSVDLRADGSCRIAFEGWPWSAPFGEKSFEDLSRWLTFDGYDWQARPPNQEVPLGVLRQGPGVDLGLVNALCSSLEVIAWGGGRTGRLRSFPCPLHPGADA
ncbi:hypothetical protein LXT21_29235 [Myxococcus sp. K38C18041901]|uniref:hypothetical protein n=1 Tax=Myxococcus guangdongensis TaxID=2906760 RepID=UPI0020A7B5F4|nr:hypothetical protein [Myxococcus guangdongensis]MCP3062876.1 hypothetical protein [Myxococcus guangdongensis]